MLVIKLRNFGEKLFFWRKKQNKNNFVFANTKPIKIIDFDRLFISNIFSFCLSNPEMMIKNKQKDFIQIDWLIGKNFLILVWFVWVPKGFIISDLGEKKIAELTNFHSIQSIDEFKPNIKASLTYIHTHKEMYPKNWFFFNMKDINPIHLINGYFFLFTHCFLALTVGKMMIFSLEKMLIFSKNQNWYFFLKWIFKIESNQCQMKKKTMKTTGDFSFRSKSKMNLWHLTYAVGVCLCWNRFFSAHSIYTISTCDYYR